MEQLKLIAILAALGAMMVSCNGPGLSRPTDAELLEDKKALADSILTEVDALVYGYQVSTDSSFSFSELELPPEKQLVKPTYLLDPSDVGNYVTRSQKVCVLAVYLEDYKIMKLYDLPTDEIEAAIAKLSAEVNHPIDTDLLLGDTPASEKVRKTYEACKERDELLYFFRFSAALLCETQFIVSRDPELFLRMISEDQWNNHYNGMVSIVNAIRETAKYDEEMAQLMSFCETNKLFESDDVRAQAFESIDSSIKYYTENKDNFEAKRSALVRYR